MRGSIVALERQQGKADIIPTSFDAVVRRMERLLESHGQHSSVRIVRIRQHDRVRVPRAVRVDLRHKFPRRPSGLGAVERVIAAADELNRISVELMSN